MSIASSELAVPVEDHRIRVARERRERTRARLLDTILATYRGAQGRGPAILDDILKSAGISKTNFYKYFPSLDAAVGELGDHLATEMTEAIMSIYTHVTRPRERFATAFQLFLSRAGIDSDWGNFIVHGSYLNPDHELFLKVRDDFALGTQCGDFEIEFIEAAVHLTIGTMIEGMRHLMQRPPSRDYILALTVMTLRGLGVSKEDAKRAAQAASDELHREGALLFSWWEAF